MLPLADAIQLLAAARDLATLHPLARLFGCDPSILPLAAEDCRSLAVPSRTRLALGQAADGRRTVLAEFPRHTNLRQALGALAARLAGGAPHLHWSVAACARGGATVVLAAWSADDARPRLAALTVERDRIVDSDAETLRFLADASTHPAPLAHARWLEILGREALGHRFFRALAREVDVLAAGVQLRSASGVTEADRRTLALLCVSRLVFLAFVEAKGWLNGDRDFLHRQFSAAAASGGQLDRTLLKPLVFGTLNTPPRQRAPVARRFGRVPFLNGGLFAPTPLERTTHPTFPDAALDGVVGGLLARWRFTAREDSTTWSDTAVDPEMLGRAFESLMMRDQRRRTGAFFTPQPVVRHVTHRALAQALAGGGLSPDTIAAMLDGESDASGLSRALIAPLRRRAAAVRVLDPACGSGAFLVHALETLADFQAHLGNTDPLSVRRRRVLTRQIHGVDTNPTAVWLCELRLWLSTIVEDPTDDPMRVPALPNLDRQIRVGDALDSDAAPGVAACVGGGEHSVVLGRVRARYARASGPRKRTLARTLDRLERSQARAALERALVSLAARRRDLLAALRSRDLFGARHAAALAVRADLVALRLLVRQTRARLRALECGGALPFAFETHFAEAHAADGFDLVLGNPPWVRAREIAGEARMRLCARYDVLRRACWTAGARAAGAGAAFGAQPELAAAFVERACELLAPGGTVALLVPAKLWRTLAGGGVRRYLLETVELCLIEDWTDAPSLFDAVTYPSLVLGQRATIGHARPGDPCTVVRHGAEPTGSVATPRSWVTRGAALPLDLDDPASPWLLLPPEVRAAFDRLRAAGIPLAQHERFGRPILGVKTGCNAAFVVRRDESHTAPLVGISGGGRSGRVEPSVLRPVVRGEDVIAWGVRGDGASLLWTHGPDGAALATLPPGAAAWLRPLRHRLAARTDARRSARWWTLFRLDAADPRSARVVWADIGRRPAAAVLPAGDPAAPLNSCYAVRCSDPVDAHALAAILNSPLAAAWLAAIAEPARGGYHRYLGWTMALFPLPPRWLRGRDRLAALGLAAARGDPPDDTTLLAAALAAYDLALDDVGALVRWWQDGDA